MWHAAKDHSNLNEGEGKEWNKYASMVKWSRHSPFTRVARVRLPLEVPVGVPIPVHASRGQSCGVDVVSFTTINLTYREESKVRRYVGNDEQLPIQL